MIIRLADCRIDPVVLGAGDTRVDARKSYPGHTRGHHSNLRAFPI
jgi:hypothetical protein